MFDQIPIRAWLLIALAAVAFAPARYVYRHIVHAPSRRDITQPPEDLAWRTSAQFVRSLSILLALAALAIFIFTPAAGRVAESPSFWPIVIVVAGLWYLISVPQALASGRIEPYVRGVHDSYQRDSQPKRFWASIAWNTALGSLFLWLGYVTDRDASAEALADKCNYSAATFPADNERAACDQLIRLRPDNAKAFVDRGLISLDSGDFDKAVADFTRAHELDPKNAWALADRGIAFAWNRNRTAAEQDFAAARRLDSSNPVMLRGEAILKLNAGDTEGAVDRLSASMVRDPDNLWALRKRAELYWDLGEVEKSRQDDQRWLQLKASAEDRGPPQPNDRHADQ